MVRIPGVWTLALAIAASSLIGSSSARADDRDIVLSRLGNTISDFEGNPVDVVGNNLHFRSMVSELGVVLAPRLLSPSDTLGFGGFQFSADFAYTSITSDADYWRVLESSNNPTGSNVSHGDSIVPTVGLFVRKGMWLPLPSFETGLGAVHLVDSDLWAAQGYAKFALHEGYHDLPLPSFAVRGAASRMMGSKDLDLTVASLDLSMSKAFGISQTVNIAPYGGWNLLIVVPRSEVIDKTPNLSPFTTPGDGAMNFVFKDQANITRHRMFLGAKLQYYVFAITLEANFAFAGSSVDDRSGNDTQCSDVVDPNGVAACDATDEARLQESYSISVGLDF